MRIALVHDWLDRRMGGAERVLLELAAMYPDAPVYTLLFDPAIYGAALEPARVRSSVLQRLPEPLRRRPRYLLPLIPRAVARWDFSSFDVVLSSSVAFVKNISTSERTLHVCYCHAPMRFAWDYWPQYLDDMDAGRLQRLAVRALVSRIRAWDLAGVAGVDRWLCNSRTTAERLRIYYGVHSATVIHPPVALDQLAPPPADTVRAGYVTLSTLTEYKRIDLAVRAFSASGLPLTVIGDGPDRRRLESLAAVNVRFAGHVDDNERVRLLQHARGLVFPNEEDFGIAPIEAMACGTPVVAYGRGGLLETVEEGRTGVFFADQTPEALTEAVARLDAHAVDGDALVAAAQRFGAPRFREEVRAAVSSAWATHRVVEAPAPNALRAGRFDLLGLHLDPLTMDEAVARIVERAAAPPAGAVYVVKPYVEFFERAAHDAALLQLLNGAWLSLADGVALQWASSYLVRARRPTSRDLVRSLYGIVRGSVDLSGELPERVAGATFTLELLRRCAAAGIGVHLVGSPRAHSIETTAQYLRGAVPGLRITGTSPGRAGIAAEAALLQQLRAENAAVVLVGMGFPRQEQLMARLAPQLDRGVLIGEGGTFDYTEFGGSTRRAPEPLRRAGLEWLWRLLLQPSRLRRQLAIPRFIRRVHAQARHPG